ncbi:potassium-transporting ATPase subunit C [Candidatus Electronema sp. JM]|uniref:potassium-transporting ATPase subunit C n=1 Tax=Candidatus Electronema sp. JM TaxID=3401571 RepID=UPI003AA89A8C
MHPASPRLDLRHDLLAGLRAAVFTMLVCGILYPALVWMIGQTLTPHAANGSALRNAQGEIIGSGLIAQGFSRPEYFWPRPSAVDYNAAGSGGSNLAATSPELRANAIAQAAKFSADASHPLPLDLAAASGSGLDPHITLAAAEYQAERVAKARNMPLGKALALLKEQQRGGLINVLAANLALDALGQ